MAKYRGSIIKRGKFYHWRYLTLEGVYTTKVIRNETGGNVSRLCEAEKIVTQWSMELSSLNQLKSREETIQKIAEVKSLLKVCRVPLTELEDTFFCPSLSSDYITQTQTDLPFRFEFIDKLCQSDPC